MGWKGEMAYDRMFPLRYEDEIFSLLWRCSGRLPKSIEIQSSLPQPFKVHSHHTWLLWSKLKQGQCYQSALLQVERANFWDVVGKGGSSFHPNRLNSRLHIGRLQVQQVRKNPFHGGFLQLVPVPFPLRAVLRLKKLNKGLPLKIKSACRKNGCCGNSGQVGQWMSSPIRCWTYCYWFGSLRAWTCRWRSGFEPLVCLWHWQRTRILE